MAKPPKFATIPRRWPGGTVACIATGSSLTPSDVAYLRGKVDGVIVVNDAVDLAPWADILYACDGKWWYWRKGQPSFTGTKYAMKDDARAFSSHGVQMLGKGKAHGFDPRPTVLCHGYNSGFQSIGVAVHSGARRIILLGFDMQGGSRHFFGQHPDNSKPPFGLCIPAFASIVGPLAALGVEVLNCTRKTALTCFPRVELELALPNNNPIVIGSEPLEVSSCA